MAYNKQSPYFGRGKVIFATGKRLGKASVAVVLSFFSLGCVHPVSAPTQAKTGENVDLGPVNQSEWTWTTHSGEGRNIQQTREVLSAMMEEYGVTGLSIALTQGVYWHQRAKSYLIELGAENPRTAKLIDASTVFPAGNLGQPIIAYIVLKFASHGQFDIDRPLFKYLPKVLSDYPEYKDLAGDARFERLTARRILSHQSGLMFSRQTNPGHKLAFDASPGKNFGYSEDAYPFLVFVLEQETGRSLQNLAKSMVFDALGMSRSSFVREPRFAGHIAAGLAGSDDASKPVPADGSEFFTTADDFNKFAWPAVTTGLGLGYEAVMAYLGGPEVTVRTSSIEGRFQPGTRPSLPRGLSWFLGWGRYALPHVSLEHCFFIGQWRPGIECYATVYASPKTTALTVFVAGSGRHAFMARILREYLGGIETPLAWLGFQETGPGR